MLNLEVKCISDEQTTYGHHTTTFVVEKNQEIDALRQEVKVGHPDMPFKIGEVYNVSIEPKK